MTKKKRRKRSAGTAAHSVLSQLDRHAGKHKTYRAQPWSDQAQPGRRAPGHARIRGMVAKVPHLLRIVEE